MLSFPFGLHSKRCSHTFKAFQQIKFLIIQCDFSLFQAGHVQDIVDQLQKLSAGKTDLLQVIRHFFLVPDIRARQIGQADDSI